METRFRPQTKSPAIESLEPRLLLSGLDFGDAPDDRELQGYPTLLVNDGARHVIDGPWLGTKEDFPDAETDGQPSSWATGDDWNGRDDENGVSIPTLTRGVQSDITVEVSGGGGVLDAWIDWNGDQSWDRSERIYGGFLGDGVHSLSVTPPLDSVARQTFARFRISSKGGLTPAGLAADGEVEDYLVTIQEPEIDQFPNALANVGIQWPTGSTEPVSLVGSTGWTVFIPPNGQAADLDGDGRDQVVARMTQMDLGGLSSRGPVTVRLAPEAPSGGQIEELANNTPGILDVPPFAAAGQADSFFDVFLEVTIGGQAFHTATPVLLWSRISHKPPAPGETYVGLSDPVELLDANGNPTGIRLFDPSYTPNAALDFGDAPDAPYPTLLASDGARHRIVAGCYLGQGVDSEPDGQPEPQAMGDDLSGLDDEDGVVFTSPLVPGVQASVDVTASMYGYLSAWIDFNGLGSWADDGDRILNSLPLSPGMNHLSFNVPITAGQGIETYARFRFSTRPVLSYTGLAPDGEVEDYRVTLQAPEVDYFPNSLATVMLDIPGIGADTATLVGPSTWEVTIGPQGQAADADGDGRDQTPARITQWEMTSTSPLFGLVVVRGGAMHTPAPPWNPPRPELGEMEERVNNTPGVLDVAPFTAAGQVDSFFDVYFEVELPALGLSFLSVDPKRLGATLTHKPAALGETYTDDGSLLPLYRWGATTPEAFLQVPLYIPNPGLEIDQFANSFGAITLDIPGVGNDTVTLSGPSTTHVMIGPEGQARDYDGDGRDQVWSEMVQLELAGSSPIFGPVVLRLRDAAEAPGLRSLGQIEELANNTPGILDVPPFAATGQAQSFFDVFFEIELPALGIVMHNDVPKSVQTAITHKPPAPGETYFSGAPQYTPLLGPLGNIVGFLGRTSYTPNPLSESIWLGRVNDHWEVSANWSAGTPGPESIAVFDRAAPNQPALYWDQSVGGVDFRTAVWTIGGRDFMLTVGPVGIDSAGAGTSTVKPAVILAADSTWTVGEGNTLDLGSPLSGGGRRLAKDGSGRLVLDGGQNHTTGLSLDINGGTVKLGGGHPVLVLDGLTFGGLFGGPRVGVANATGNDASGAISPAAPATAGPSPDGGPPTAAVAPATTTTAQVANAPSDGAVPRAYSLSVSGAEVEDVLSSSAPVTSSWPTVEPEAPASLDVVRAAQAAPAPMGREQPVESEPGNLLPVAFVPCPTPQAAPDPVLAPNGGLVDLLALDVDEALLAV